MSQLTAWSPFFQGSDRMKGRALQLGDHVQRHEPADGLLAAATVMDNGTPHEVTLAQDGRHAVAECTCETFLDGAFCPHIWALLVTIERSDEDDDIDLWNTLVGLQPRPPKARKREESERPIKSRDPDWVGRLAMLRPATDEHAIEGDSVFPAQRQVCYTVLPEPSARHNGLVIEVRQRSIISSGWSKTKPLKISPDLIRGLDDPADRELCALLVGATWVTAHEAGDALEITRSHAMYRVAGGARRRLLRRMIKTGRAFVETEADGDETPLTWDRGRTGKDQPWTAWLVGEEREDHLWIDMHLRREGKPMPVTAPDLILGGNDGLIIHDGQASAFDDHDAFRWVSQFRDRRDRYADDEADVSGFRVEEADLPRFLERLYMLPQLPEIDLPDGVGRSEQRLKPVPRLELFSPGSAQSVQPIALAPTTAKSHLLGRLAFIYADEPINPSQPGRFVTIGNAEAPNEDDDSNDEPGETNEPVTEAAADSDTATEVLTEPTTETETETETDQDEAGETELTTDAGRLIRRDRRSERDAIGITSSLGLRPIASPTQDTLLVPIKHVPFVVGDLIERGWQVLADQQAIRTAGPPSLSITSGIDWFELRGGVKFKRDDGEEQEVSLPEVLAAARAGRTMIELGDGSQGLLPQQWLAEHGLLTSLARIEGDHLRFRSSQAALLDTLLNDQELVSFDQAFADARKRLHAFDGINPLDPNGPFKGELRSYQRFGLGWMDFLRWFGMGGILADDMGLGKTIQVLAMLQNRKLAALNAPPTSNGNSNGSGGNGEAQPHLPSIIVVPRSVIFNWIDEAQHFTPELRVTGYTGPERAEIRDNLDQYDLIVTSYGLMRRDIEQLSAFDFDYAVLDEAQAIKNPQSQSAKAARLIKARHRLALTGTPVENHLGDLWSIVEFLNPGMLGSSGKFGDLIRSRGEAAIEPVSIKRVELDDDDELIDPTQEPAPADPLVQTAKALRPFILRRTKQQVLTDLPEKTEQTIVCEMEPAQRKLYNQLRDYYRGTLAKRLDAEAGTQPGEESKGLGRASFMVLEALLRLRQAACHPGLIDRQNLTGILQDPDPTIASAKLDELESRLADIIDSGSKALVFSQFTTMLGLVRDRLDTLGVRYAYLDGQTRNRKQIVQQFQEDPDLQVFLISLKAGGVGLNLTAAEYVFILDPWWNPAVEAQAIDRAHRIGQTNPVFAYRLICEDTVEQRILELQARKRELADAIVGGEQNLLSNLSREDLEQLLS
ncbi:MAG: DEAD/DEAH box helicase [Planctomycetota bacterium]